MAVIGATQLEPVNVLGQYVQGLEAGRAATRQRAADEAAMMEAQRAAELRNFLSATPDLMTPEAQNQLLRFGKPGAEMAASLADISGKRATARKTDLEIAAKGVEMVAREAGGFLANPSALNKATLAPWVQSAVQRGILQPEDTAKFDALPDDPTALATALQQLQTQGMSLVDQLRYQRPEGTTRDVGGVVVTVDPFTGREIGRVDLSAEEMAARTAGAPRTTVNLPPAGKKFSETLGEKAALRLDEFRTKAESARRTLNLSDRLRPLLNDPTFISGTFAQKRTAVARALGMDVAATEAFFAGIGDQVAERITQFGAGTGLSDADRQYAKQIVGGEETFSKEGIEKIMRINDETARDVIRIYGSERERLAKKEPEVLDYYPELTIETNLSPQDQQALDWANSNPTDPRAAQIKQRLGVR